MLHLYQFQQQKHRSETYERFLLTSLTSPNARDFYTQMKESDVFADIDKNNFESILKFSALLVSFAQSYLNKLEKENQQFQNKQPLCYMNEQLFSDALVYCCLISDLWADGIFLTNIIHPLAQGRLIKEQAQEISKGYHELVKLAERVLLGFANSDIKSVTSKYAETKWEMPMTRASEMLIAGQKTACNLAMIAETMHKDLPNETEATAMKRWAQCERLSAQLKEFAVSKINEQVKITQQKAGLERKTSELILNGLWRNLNSFFSCPAEKRSSGEGKSDWTLYVKVNRKMQEAFFPSQHVTNEQVAFFLFKLEKTTLQPGKDYVLTEKNLLEVLAPQEDRKLQSGVEHSLTASTDRYVIHRRNMTFQVHSWTLEMKAGGCADISWNEKLPQTVDQSFADAAIELVRDASDSHQS
ncbi:MAG: hypothetical protein K2X81_04205 [Candidatus Obscuribacterales bacterium]|jgi:hypothetical protein|nr:hypothetical protein [Candidatus Obscuribacterales bacterium]